MRLKSTVLKSLAIAGVCASATLSAKAATAGVSFYGLVFDTGSQLLLSSQTGSTTVNTLLLGSPSTNWDPLNLNQGGSWGARITGCIEIPSSGNYSFKLDSAESAYLYIDNTLVVNNGKNSVGGFFKTPNDNPSGTPTFPASHTGSINLSAGYHTIRVDYLNVLGNLDSGKNYVQTTYLVGNNYVDLPLTDCPAVPEVGSLYAAGALVGAVALRSRFKKSKATA